jgi:hypothetical protein
MPVGPSYRDRSRPSASIVSGSEAVPLTGTGRVCGLSASSAPSVMTSSTSSWAAIVTSSSQKPRQRMFGSRPAHEHHVAVGVGQRQTETRVVGQVIRRVAPSTSETCGRLTWKS